MEGGCEFSRHPGGLGVPERHQEVAGLLQEDVVVALVRVVRVVVLAQTAETGGWNDFVLSRTETDFKISFLAHFLDRGFVNCF